MKDVPVWGWVWRREDLGVLTLPNRDSHFSSCLWGGVRLILSLCVLEGEEKGAWGRRDPKIQAVPEDASFPCPDAQANPRAAQGPAREQRSSTAEARRQRPGSPGARSPCGRSRRRAARPSRPWWRPAVRGSRGGAAGTWDPATQTGLQGPNVQPPPRDKVPLKIQSSVSARPGKLSPGYQDVTAALPPAWDHWLRPSLPRLRRWASAPHSPAS